MYNISYDTFHLGIGLGIHLNVIWLAICGTSIAISSGDMKFFDFEAIKSLDGSGLKGPTWSFQFSSQNVGDHEHPFVLLCFVERKPIIDSFYQ